MKAAVVTTFDQAPHYLDFSEPQVTRDTDMVVDVIAAGLHPRVRSQADGSHYTATDELPLVPGVDGVGRGPDGRMRYFVMPDTTLGSMAEKTLIDTRRSVVLPDDSDAYAVAAALNPAMSSWIPFARRVPFEKGMTVLVLGATGNAGQMAVQNARLFGAAEVVAVARDAAKLEALPALGATHTIALGDDASARLAEVGRGVDVVIDYLWGAPMVEVAMALATNRDEDAKPLYWVEVGSMAGAEASIPSAALRAINLQILGSGQGSVTPRGIIEELPAIAAEITKGTYAVTPRQVKLADVEAVWKEPVDAAERIVLVP